MTVSSVSLRDKRKAFTASLVGTSLEWYDFAVYSASAALLFPRLFFPSSDSFTGVILAFSTYAVGYVARPLGALFFGRLGDRIGRKHVLVATLVLIGAATFLIGLLPTYGTIGFWAPLLLVLLRLAQGIGVGGELGVAVLYSNENGDTRRRGFWSSASQIGPPAGNLLANAALAVISGTLSDEAFFSWGWRVAFLLSAVLVAFGLWIRIRLEDTPIAKAIHASGDQADAPLRDVFRTESRGLIAAAFSRIGPDVTYALFTVFVYTYATMVVGFERSQVLVAVLIGSAIQVLVIPCAGALTDRFNRRLVFGIAAAAAAVWPFIFFPLIEGRSGLGLTLGVITGLVIHSAMYGPQGAFITDQFSPSLRSTGSSMGFAIGSTFGGAIAPLAFAALFENNHSWLPIAIYIAVACSISIIGMLLGRDYKASEDARYLGAPSEPALTPSPATRPNP